MVRFHYRSHAVKPRQYRRSLFGLCFEDHLEHICVLHPLSFLCIYSNYLHTLHSSWQSIFDIGGGDGAALTHVTRTCFETCFPWRDSLRVRIHQIVLYFNDSELLVLNNLLFSFHPLCIQLHFRCGHLYPCFHCTRAVCFRGKICSMEGAC